MSSMIRQFHSVQLTEEEKEESAIYICYERTLYHYFKRNHDIKNFNWLFVDRFFGFSYSENNEPIIPIQNGLYTLIQSMQQVITFHPKNIRSIMEQKFKEGYSAHAMVECIRANGTKYNSSTLFEGMQGEIVYYTRTNPDTDVTCLPIKCEELVNRIPKDENGLITICFIKMPVALLESLNFNGIRLYKEIVTNLYGLSYEDKKIKSNNNSLLEVTANGLEYLLKYYELNKEKIVSESITKREQVRMHKHIANKIEPMLFAWDAILNDFECKERIGKECSETIIFVGNKIKGILKDLYKWASLVVSRPQLKFINQYINELCKLIEEYKKYQSLVYNANIMILTAK